jgi:hypothetical protein
MELQYLYRYALVSSVLIVGPIVEGTNMFSVELESAWLACCFAVWGNPEPVM